jgi:hypothetical protein
MLNVLLYILNTKASLINILLQSIKKLLSYVNVEEFLDLKETSVIIKKVVISSNQKQNVR